MLNALRDIEYSKSCSYVVIHNDLRRLSYSVAQLAESILLSTPGMKMISASLASPTSKVAVVVKPKAREG